jgi:hypothetical protein
MLNKPPQDDFLRRLLLMGLCHLSDCARLFGIETFGASQVIGEKLSWEDTNNWCEPFGHPIWKLAAAIFSTVSR